ncbi:MAG: hypothetical protein QM611_06800 [Microbacterium sp.]|uniref:hypothetical protein n=1 Tax=Microbacterium sp. TaxID=51671 RepID=UPI0039E63DBE
MIEEPLLACLTDVFSSDGQVGIRDVLALPTSGDPRAFVPVAHRRSAARALWRQYAGGGARRRAETTALASLVTIGFAGRVPRWRVSFPDPPSESAFHPWLRTVLHQPYYVGIVLIGPRRANRKPVVMLTDRQGALIAVAKLGYNRVTRPLVRHEANALRDVAAALEGRAHVPVLLASDRLEHTEAMLMNPLPKINSGKRVSRETLVAVVRGIASSAVGRRTDLSTVIEHPRMRPIVDAANRVSARTSQAPVGAAHGDLHAGNLGVAEDGRPVIWDWERWTHGVPVGFDLLHHDLQSWVSGGSDPQEAARRLLATAPEILAPLGVPTHLAADIACDYLVRLAARYVDDAQDQAGSKLGTVENWLFPAVLDHQQNEERT